LVVGEFGSDTCVLVADTKLTWSQDDQRTRRVYQEAIPKLVILRDDLCVGVAGEDPHGVIADLVANRDASPNTLLHHLSGRRHASFLVASSDPVRLWRIGDGSVEEIPRGRRAWIGSNEAFSHYQRLASQWAGTPLEHDAVFLSLSSMQGIVSHGLDSTVGGHTVQVVLRSSGFRYAALPTTIGPEEVVFRAAVRPNNEVRLQGTAAPGHDADLMRIVVAVGESPTPGALAFWIVEADHALLFTDEAPHRPITLTVTSADELVRVARSHGQTLTW
jgi:hypothetical protein